jgi:hypothetical protein
MGTVVSIHRFSDRRRKSTAALAASLRIHDLRERNEEFMRFLATERSRHLAKVEELDRLIKTISEEWGIELPLAGPEGC